MIIEYKVHLKSKTKDELIAFILQLQNLLDNKDRQIDLMARAFKQDDVRTVEEIKQYFERKATKMSQERKSEE